MMRILVGIITTVILLMRTLRRKSTSTGNAPEVKSMLEVSAPKRRNVSNIISMASVVVAGLSAIFAYNQAAISRDQALTSREQADLSRKSLEQAITTEDLRFVGGMTVEIDGGSDLIKISNRSGLPVVEAAVWTLGISPEPGGDNDFDNHLDTVRARLAGIPSCHTLEFSRTEFLNLAREQIPSATATEAHLTIRAPSRTWYTVSSKAAQEVIRGDWEDAIEAASHSPSDQILGDTMQEAVRIQDARFAELDDLIGQRTPVTEFTAGNAVLVRVEC